MSDTKPVVRYHRYCGKGHGTTSTTPDITTAEECGWPKCHEANLSYLFEGLGYVSEVLGIFQLADHEGGTLSWNIQKDGPHFRVRCSDFFVLAMSDSEAIEVEDVPLLRECFKELHEQIGGFMEVYLNELYVCRKRQERPMKRIFTSWQTDCPALAELVADYPNKEEEYWARWNAEHSKGR